MPTNQTWEVLHASFYFVRRMKVHLLGSFLLIFFPVSAIVLLALIYIPEIEYVSTIVRLILIPISISLFVCIVNESNYLYNEHKYVEQISFSMYYRRIFKRYFYYLSNFIFMIPLILFFWLMFSLVLMPLTLIMMVSENLMPVYGFMGFFFVLFCLKIVFPFITYENKNLFSALPMAIGLFFSKFKSTILLFLFSILIQFAIIYIPLFLYNQIIYNYINSFSFITQDIIRMVSMFALIISIIVGIITNIWGISLFNFQYLSLKHEIEEERRAAKIGKR